MFKNLNRGVSTSLAIGIIIILIIVVGGGILAYQYGYIPRMIQAPTAETPEETPSNKTKALSVYLTAEKYDGNLGGRLGADAKCSLPSGLACESGTIHALLTVSENDSILNMGDNYQFNRNIPIYWYNRENNKTLILANNWSGMIKVNKYGWNSDVLNGQGEGTGKGVFAGDFPWTGGASTTGELQSCNQWTSNGGNLETAAGPFGTIGGVDKQFLLSSDGWAGISFSKVCKNKRYLRCICEGNLEDIAKN